LAAIVGLLHGCITYQGYCTYDNPLKIDFAALWYHETPVPQLIVASQVSGNWVLFFGKLKLFGFS
jgi:hypothetical protein